MLKFLRVCNYPVVVLQGFFLGFPDSRILLGLQGCGDPSRLWIDSNCCGHSFDSINSMAAITLG